MVVYSVPYKSNNNRIADLLYLFMIISQLLPTLEIEDILYCLHNNIKFLKKNAFIRCQQNTTTRKDKLIYSSERMKE